MCIITSHISHSNSNAHHLFSKLYRRIKIVPPVYVRVIFIVRRTVQILRIVEYLPASGQHARLFLRQRFPDLSHAGIVYSGFDHISIYRKIKLFFCDPFQKLRQIGFQRLHLVFQCDIPISLFHAAQIRIVFCDPFDLTLRNLNNVSAFNHFSVLCLHPLCLLFHIFIRDHVPLDLRRLALPGGIFRLPYDPGLPLLRREHGQSPHLPVLCVQTGLCRRLPLLPVLADHILRFGRRHPVDRRTASAECQAGKRA